MSIWRNGLTIFILYWLVLVLFHAILAWAGSLPLQVSSPPCPLMEVGDRVMMRNGSWGTITGIDRSPFAKYPYKVGHWRGQTFIHSHVMANGRYWSNDNEHKYDVIKWVPKYGTETLRGVFNGKPRPKPEGGQAP